MSARKQALFWLTAIASLVFVLVLFEGILLPFITGLAVAYFLDPSVDYLERRGMPRSLGATFILGGFGVVLTIGLLLVAPLLKVQLLGLLTGIPQVLDGLRQSLTGVLSGLSVHIDEHVIAEGERALMGGASSLMGWFFQLLGGAWQSGLTIINLIGLLVITPVVSWYLLRDWDLLIARIDSWLPRNHVTVIRQQVGLINCVLASFVRGQATVCLILALTYALALELIGLDHGLVVGLIAGFASFIPYVGAVIGLVLSTGLAYAQFGNMAMIVTVAAIFIVGQIIEGSLLTPKLVGDRVGLHAVWVVFALLAGGSLCGFVGVLLAVPVAAVVGVLSRFVLQRYLSSRIFLGRDLNQPDDNP